MWTKVSWLTLWVTLAFWYGCGESRTLHLNAGEDETPLLAERTTAAPAAGAASGPSLTGLERKNWEPVVIGPARGIVTHYPVYFRSERYLPAATRTSPLTRDGDIQREAELVLDNDSNVALGGTDLRRMALEPLGFGADMILLPARMVVTPPWTVQTTPP